MRFGSIAAAGVLGLIGVAPAQALTISNFDPEAHTVTVTAGSDAKELTIEPEKDVDATCNDGCKVKLENGEEYELKGGESVSIEDGVIFVDHSPDAELGEDMPDLELDAAPDGGKEPDLNAPADEDKSSPLE